jgi:hypothetical protein
MVYVMMIKVTTICAITAIVGFAMVFIIVMTRVWMDIVMTVVYQRVLITVYILMKTMMEGVIVVQNTSISSKTMTWIANVYYVVKPDGRFVMMCVAGINGVNVKMIMEI